jgi:hypothetical protein
MISLQPNRVLAPTCFSDLSTQAVELALRMVPSPEQFFVQCVALSRRVPLQKTLRK